MNIKKIISACALLFMGSGGLALAADNPTKFTNRGSITNTRHNMTQVAPPGGTISPINTVFMSSTRNDYGEICVYCHTPHGANTTVTLPLWNRTVKATTYTTYNQLGTSSLTQVVAQPGQSSLSCLSCHDGQTAIDSIINMPGSGRYLKDMETNNQTSPAGMTFLNSWPGTAATDSHYSLSNGFTGCLVCHNSLGIPGATDFAAFAIGTDLKNDHPVGITYPATTSGTGTDFKTPAGKKGPTFFFDKDGNGNMDSADVRLYDNGGAAKVECASCHDPHGVPSAGPGTVFNPSFLRVANTSSALCQTCHAK